MTGETDLDEPWLRQALLESKGCCANCGGTDRVRPKMIVPEEAGGQKTPSNVVILCRACDLAAEATRPNSSGRRLVNFWVSRPLYDWMHDGSGFESMGALVRFVMSKYVADDGRYDDLEQYQDAGTDVKVNVWVESDRYGTFKTLVDKRGMTVTDAFKALITLYRMETAQAFSKKES